MTTFVIPHLFSSLNPAFYSQTPQLPACHCSMVVEPPRELSFFNIPQIVTLTFGAQPRVSIDMPIFCLPLRHMPRNEAIDNFFDTPARFHN